MIFFHNTVTKRLFRTELINLQTSEVLVAIVELRILPWPGWMRVGDANHDFERLKTISKQHLSA